MDPKLLEQHNSEMARAAAAAIEQHYQETIEITSELLTSGIYEQMESAAPSEVSSGPKAEARRARAEVRLMMATAMHYADAHYEDIVRVLSFAMDAPAHIQKDVYFTLAVVQLSFGHDKEARDAMQQALAIIKDMRNLKTNDLESDADIALEIQEREAEEFLKQMPSGKPQ
jgi:hypothetical protein